MHFVGFHLYPAFLSCKSSHAIPILWFHSFYVGNNKKMETWFIMQMKKLRNTLYEKGFSISHSLTLLFVITILYEKLPYPGHDKYQTCVGCNVSKYLFFLIRLFCIRYSFRQPSTNIDSDTLEIFWKNKAYAVFVSKYHT